MSDNSTPHREPKFDPTETIHVEPPSMRERLESMRRARAKEARSSTSIPTVAKPIETDTELATDPSSDED